MLLLYLLMYLFGFMFDGNCIINIFSFCCNKCWFVLSVVLLFVKFLLNINVIFNVNFCIKVICLFDNCVFIVVIMFFKLVVLDFIIFIKFFSNMILFNFLIDLCVLFKLYNNFFFWKIGVLGLFRYFGFWLVYVWFEYLIIFFCVFFKGNIIWFWNLL